jgi:predicted Zn-dependent protease
MQIAEKKYAEAEQTYGELKSAQVSDDTKNEAEFLQAEVNIQAGKADKAMTILRGLATRLPKDRIGMRARVAEAECLAAAGKTADANKLLHDMLKDSTDKGLKAMAYNTLGKNHFKQGQFKEALWEFLWVDVVYNQDKNEHAKALYYLSQVFDKLGDRDRAQECREALNDRQFAGLEFQRLAQSEAKTP